MKHPAHPPGVPKTTLASTACVMTQAKFPTLYYRIMRVNFHREASLTLFYFFFGFPVEYLDLSCRFCYNLFWIVMPKTK